MTQRERFETWFNKKCGDGMFALSAKRIAWKSWQAACPEGWQAVPRNLIKPMREAFHEANEACDEGADGGVGSPDFQWQALLTTAPKPGENE